MKKNSDDFFLFLFFSVFEYCSQELRRRAESGHQISVTSIFGHYQSFCYCVINTPVQLHLVYILIHIIIIKEQYWAIAMTLERSKPIRNWGILKETEWQCQIVPMSQPHGASMPILLTPKWLDLDQILMYFVPQKEIEGSRTCIMAVSKFRRVEVEMTMTF